MAEAEGRYSPLVGRRLGEFVVREELSSGGFGTVFRAEQPLLAREAVIKVMHTRLRASETLIQRFLREARLASRLDHPYAAHIYAFGAEADGVLWIAMELVRGTPLDKLLEIQGPIPLERFVPLLERICQVVQTAHDQGIVHRDLKPANVMVLARAGQLLPKLLDLGIAKLDAEDVQPRLSQPMPVPEPAPMAADDAFAATVAPIATRASTGDGRLTEEGAIMGSPLYMAPEQWTDAAAVDARTDIYALGILCHEALTGKPPYSGSTRFAIAKAHAQQQPPPLGKSFPPALDAVVGKALAKLPGDRYASAIELSNAFKAASGIADEPVALPRLAEELRVAVLARAPQPLAQAVAALEAARNAHQARDAVWQVVRVAARLIGVAALAAHSHVGGGGGKISESGVTEALRRLRKRAMPDAEWIALARELGAPFDRLRDAYPIPELIDFFATGAGALSELIGLRDAADGGASDEQVRDMLTAAMPVVEALLRSLAFFSDYRLVVATERGAEVWMGVRRDEPSRMTLRGPPLPAGQPALVNADGVPVVSLYPFVQRHAPAQGVAEQLFFFEGKGRRGARLVALPESFEIEDEVLWDVVGGMVREPTESQDGISIEEVCPFPGLASFTPEDASRFFGRERETEGFVNRLRAQALLAVVGPSGAGKSSFIQAGVVPNLPADWQVVTLRPGAAPLISLTARLATVGFDTAMLRSELRDHPGGLGTMLRARLTRGVLVIVIDQLEELFTLCDDVAERNLFAEALVRSARSIEDPVRVVFTLRDDFLLHAEALPALRARLAPALHLLTTPGRDDLLRILNEPLRQAGYELDDPKLAGEMVDALATTRSSLALLSFTASKLWELRDRRFRQISRKAYTSLGGVGGALAQHAEATLAAMLPEEQRLVREVFRHAVTAEGTRAVLSRTELDQILGSGPYAAAVVEKLVAARLLVTAESAAGGEQVEVTHEALIVAWPRLVTWRREDAEGARLRDQLRAAARQWEERGRPTGLLWRGDALAEYRLWRGRYPGQLTDVENAFAAASVGDAARATRRRQVTLAVAFTVLAAGVVALLFLNRSANEQRAVAQDRMAETRRTAEELLRQRRDQSEEQGRSALVDLHDAVTALRYLEQSATFGASGPSHDMLVAFAARVPASQLRKLALPNASNRAAFSPDGTKVVTACDDGRARIFDITDGRQVLEVKQDREVQRVEFTPDGTAILSAGLDGTAVLWDAARGTANHKLVAGAPGDNLVCARISPDGRYVITATDHDATALWDAATGKQLAVLHEAGDRGDAQVGTPCAFTADSSRVAFGDTRGVTRVWDTGGGLIATASGHTGQINRVEFSPDGRVLATASNDGTARVWDAATGTQLHELRHRDRVWIATFSPDGKRLATASNDHTAIVWDVATGAKQLLLTGHHAGVNKAAFRPDGAQLATIADDGVTYLWDAKTGRREASLQGHGASIDDVAYDRSGTRLVTAGDDSQVIVWSAAAQQPARRFEGATGTVFAVDFSPDGRLLAGAGSGGEIWLWDRATAALVRTMTQPGPVFDARFSPDGRWLASAGRDGKIHVWEVATGKDTQLIAGHTDMIRQLAWTLDGTRIASASADGTARISAVGATQPQQVFELGSRVTGVAFAPGGNALITVGTDGDIKTWSVATGKPLATTRYAPKPKGDVVVLEHVAYDHAGHQLLGSSTNLGVAVVWDAGGEPSDGHKLAGHHGNVMGAAWSPDGMFAITGSIDSSAKLWDARTGRELATFDLDLAQVWSVAYARDGRSVATGTKDGGVLVWELPAISPR